MKRLLVFTVLALLLVSKTICAEEDEYSGGTSHFSFAARGGFFFPDNKDFRRVYGQWSNDMYFFELGWYPIKNLVVAGTGGFYYENSHTIGTVTPTFSGEFVAMVLVPLELGLQYRFKFRKNQLIIPELGASYDFIYFNENTNPGPTVEGWKQGYTLLGGILISLDRFDPGAAWNLLNDYGINNTYFLLAGEYTHAGSANHGLNLSGFTYTAGLMFEF